VEIIPFKKFIMLALKQPNQCYVIFRTTITTEGRDYVTAREVYTRFSWNRRRAREHIEAGALTAAISRQQSRGGLAQRSAGNRTCMLSYATVITTSWPRVSALSRWQKSFLSTQSGAWAAAILSQIASSNGRSPNFNPAGLLDRSAANTWRQRPYRHD